MSNEMIPDASVAEGTPAEAPEAQGGNPWLKMVPKAAADANKDLLEGLTSFDGFLDKSFSSMRDANRLRQFDGATVVPGEDADDEAWSALWGKLGRPDDQSEYGIEEEALATIFHNANLTKDQAAEIADGLVEYSNQTEEDYKASKKESYEKAVEGLKAKYGDDLPQKLESASAAMGNLGGPELTVLLQEKGLDNDPQMIEFFVNVGTLMQEGNIPIGHKLHPKPKGFEGSYDTMQGID